MNKTKIIIISTASTALVLLSGFLIHFFTTRPDYSALLAATDTVLTAARPSDFYHFSDLTDGQLTEAEHDAAVQEATATIDSITTYLNTLEDTSSSFQKSHIEQTPYQEQYESFESTKSIVTTKLQAGRDDLHLYITFANRFYASNLRHLTGSDAENYDLLATVSDEQIDQIFEPLRSASSEGLLTIGEQLAAAVKKLTAFYSKYAVYISGQQAVTGNIYDELTRDSAELQDATNQLNITLDEKVIFNLEDAETAALDCAVLDLHNSFRQETN